MSPVSERPGELDRRHVAQQLLDRRAGQARVGPQPRQLLGVLEEGQHAAGDQVDRGLVPGHQQEDGR